MTESPLFTLAVHAGEDPSAHAGALSTPIYQSAVYAFPDARHGAAIHEGEEPGYFYGRMGTPTQSALERALAALEGGADALALASGMAAISTALLTVLGPGDHLVAPRSLYASTRSLMTGILAPAGIDTSFVDGTSPASWAAAVGERTGVLFAETPANPTLEVTDLESLAALARRSGARLIVDNTFATPFNQRPLALGADLVVHSASKYLGGHGDLVAGVLVGDAEIVHRARWRTAKLLGGTIAPHTAWLVLRGLKTLPLRMERHNRSAQTVAEALAGHPRVARVHYPGLAADPGHDVARRQMSGFGGVVAFDVGSVAAGRRLLDGLRLCTLAVSLGDVATLIQHSASMTHASVPAAERRTAGISDGLLRLSVGLESAADIVDDLTAALAAV